MRESVAAPTARGAVAMLLPRAMRQRRRQPLTEAVADHRSTAMRQRRRRQSLTEAVADYRSTALLVPPTVITSVPVG